MTQTATAVHETLPVKRDSNVVIAHRLRPKPLRWARKADIDTIIETLSGPDDLERQVGFLGLKLGKKQLRIVIERLEAKAKDLKRQTEEEREAEEKRLKDLLHAAIREVIPGCAQCGHDSLEPEISSKYVEGTSLDGQRHYGARPHGYTQYKILFVYCPIDKVVHFDPGLKKVESRYNQGEFTIKYPGQRFPPFA